ncbi:MarR family winged helix-turn-helix transcriptional regulator [Pengzhenrongella sp.]|uniref:MarR family winged helix-turn-helix transcriptional regulator n=1 Tax=Pengzhenrongella sp. TaxID=2888820 RepID=UPI002F92A1AC
MNNAADLGPLLGPLRRSVLRATRRAADLPDLAEAQIELLRALRDGPASPGAVAQRLRVSPSTVSNLVRTMAAQGLVARESSASDLRGAQLSSTGAARALLTRYDRASRDMLEQALGSLPPESQVRLSAAIPDLRALLQVLEDGADRRE